MMWRPSHRRDPVALELADRHYSRQKPGTDQFVKPGSCLVLFAETATGRALWVTSNQLYAKHDWQGAWECALFRNEGAGRASTLIRQAIAATREWYGRPPADGMVTFVDPRCVRPKADPGHSFIIAGFRSVGTTKAGLIALRIAPDRMPPAATPQGVTWPLFNVEEAA